MAAESSVAEGPFRELISGVGIPSPWLEGLDATAVGRLLRRRYESRLDGPLSKFGDIE